MATEHRDQGATEAAFLDRLERSLTRHWDNTLAVVPTSDEAVCLAGNVAARLRAGGHPVQEVNAANIASAFDLLRLAGHPESAQAPADNDRRLLYELAASSPPRLQPRFIVVCEIPDPELGWQLFGRHRDDLWEINYKWLVFITPDELDTYTTPPADTFFPCVTYR